MQPVTRRGFKRHNEALARAVQGGVLLRPAGSGTKVRHVTTGRVLPCCYGLCEKDGDDTIRIMVDHDTPRWIDEATGRREQLVYIFCSDFHKGLYARQLAQR
jgi:hypothetical protein